MDREGESGSWPLLVASTKGHVDVVRALIKGGANVDKSVESLFFTDTIKATSLVLAANLDVLKELLRAGATPEALRAGANPEERFLLFVMLLLENSWRTRIRALRRCKRPAGTVRCCSVLRARRGLPGQCVC